ncbi:ABC transporter permease [Chelativorans sp. J32]|uniref:ABC transporter permease n=1 Tax=Chelativorans sp. J32 TaxID=935840 RepID=UPI0004B8E18E|nr:ABC transporter permease [Chelativorans sp. J32]
MRRRFSPGRIALTLWAYASFFFLVAPMLVIVPLSFTDANYLTFPSPGYSFRWYEKFFTDGAWIDATLLSLRIGLMATAASLFLGTALALAIVREKVPGAALMQKAFTAPMIVPVIVYSVGIYYLFAGWRFTGNATAIAAAHTILALPYVVIIVTAGLREFDSTQELAAYGLGAGRWATITRIVLPQIAPSMLSAALFAFITSFDDLVVALFLSGFQPTLPQKMFENIKIDVDPTISAVSVLQIAFIVLIGIMVLFWNRRVP